jgi:integrase
MFASCDRGTAAGRRDLAILTLLARMGLRAGEVAGLRLDDIDWRLGEITVRDEGNRRDRLSCRLMRARLSRTGCGTVGPFHIRHEPPPLDTITKLI